MKKTLVLALSAISLASIASASDRTNGWEIGPEIRGKNYSVGMPSSLREGEDGPFFDFPYPDVRAGHVHYVTHPARSLLGAKEIRLRYRIDAAPGTRFHPRENPRAAATLSLYFQRRGDNWTARRGYETYRWYVSSDKMMPLRPGVHEVTVSLDDNWTAVTRSNARNNPEAFRGALANTDRVGFVFGSSGGRGHGVYATAPARFTLLDFEIR